MPRDCIYCLSAVDEDEDGWGFILTEDNRACFHLECMEMFEGVVA